MTNQKKALIILGILAVIFILFIVTGIFMDRDERPKPDKETAMTYGDNKPLSTLFAKPISIFTPVLSTGALHFKPTFKHPNRFTIDSDSDNAFRSLKLSLENISGKTDWPVQCSFTYKNDKSSIEELRDQSDILRSSESTTIAVTKEGGDLDLTPFNGCRVLMEYRGKTVYICEKSKTGKFTVNPMFR